MNEAYGGIIAKSTVARECPFIRHDVRVQQSLRGREAYVEHLVQGCSPGGRKVGEGVKELDRAS